MTEPDTTVETAPEPEPLVKDALGVHARAIWDNTEALTKPLIVSMYGVSDSLTKSEMVQTIVRRYTDTRPDQLTREDAE